MSLWCSTHLYHLHSGPIRPNCKRTNVARPCFANAPPVLSHSLLNCYTAPFVCPVNGWHQVGPKWKVYLASIQHSSKPVMEHVMIGSFPRASVVEENRWRAPVVSWHLPNEEQLQWKYCSLVKMVLGSFSMQVFTTQGTLNPLSAIYLLTLRPKLQTEMERGSRS